MVIFIFIFLFMWGVSTSRCLPPGAKSFSLSLIPLLRGRAKLGGGVELLRGVTLRWGGLGHSNWCSLGRKVKQRRAQCRGREEGRDREGTH
jgi:hypothetical protein